MNTKILSKSLILIFLLNAFISCDDTRFLQENPETIYTMDNVFSSEAQINQAIISCYSHIRNITALENQSMIFWKGGGTDLMEYGHNRIGSSMNNYTRFNPEHNTIYGLYNDFYKIISRANLALYGASLPEILWSSQEAKTYAIAQAKFFRAYAYGNLVELWGGVPLVTEVINTAKVDFKRETATVIYQYAIDELLAIENDLPVTTNEGGRIVRGAAQHFLCELYLGLGIELDEEGQAAEANTAYANAIAYSNKVIDGGIYSLIDSRFGTRKDESLVVIDVYKNGVFKPSEKVDTIQLVPNFYWDMFQEGNINYQDGNSECIWAVQIDWDTYLKEDKNSKLAYTRIYGADMAYGTNFVHINTQLEEVSGRGIVVQTPTFYWRDKIWEDKWGDDIRNSEAVRRKRFKANVPTSPYYLQVIPWSVLNNFSSSRWTHDITYCYPISTKITTDKFTGVAQGENRSNLFRDDYIFRLAETILLRAEAKQRIGDLSGAASDINLLRSRANCSYLVTSEDLNDKFEVILDERARELMYEEKRWNTLLRMRGTIGVDRIKEHMLWDENRATLTFEFNKLPIPQAVIDSNIGSKIEQNPGWN